MSTSRKRKTQSGSKAVPCPSQAKSQEPHPNGAPKSPKNQTKKKPPALHRLTEPNRLLREHHLRAKKHFGQNFLHDKIVVESIAQAVAPTPGGSVLEIGAGLGALTAALLERVEFVAAIERDRDLIPILSEELENFVSAGSLTLYECDAKTTNFLEVLAGHPRPWAVTGNLPYQLTGSLLRKLCGVAPRVDRAVTMVQLEVADRMVATPRSKLYGALSVFLQAAFEVNRIRKVGRGAFHPAPRVDSAVVSLVPRAELIAETPRFQHLVRAGFSQRRKKLRSAWKTVPEISPDQLEAAATSAGISLEQRAEELSVLQFQAMTQALESLGAKR